MRVKCRQERVKTPNSHRARDFAGRMSLEAGLLVAAVIAIAIYLLAALIFPERF